MSEVKTVSGGPPVPSVTLVQADQSTILGDGSRERPLHAIPAGMSADQVTILGTGLPGDPLRAGVTGATFRASFRGGSTKAAPGVPVFVSFVAQSGGVTTVQPTDPRGVAVVDSFARVSGVVASVHGDGTVQVQTQGLLTLTMAQWDQVTGAVGGLVLGRTYSSDVDGGLTDVPSTKPGDFVTEIGVAVSPTTLLLELERPVQNLGGQIVFARFAGQPLPVGSAVVAVGDRRVDAAVSDVSVDAAQAVGVVCGFDVSGDPIVQISGVVTLTGPQWDQVTDTAPGMKIGSAYFVDARARPGRLTGSAPTAGAKVQVGVGLSATQFLLSAAPFLDRLS